MSCVKAQKLAAAHSFQCIYRCQQRNELENTMDFNVKWCFSINCCDSHSCSNLSISCCSSPKPDTILIFPLPTAPKPQPCFSPGHMTCPPLPPYRPSHVPKTSLASFERHRVDLHQEAHACRHHHRLCLRFGLHAASGHRVPDPGLEEAAAGHIGAGLPAHLLHLVGEKNAQFEN